MCDTSDPRLSNIDNVELIRIIDDEGNAARRSTGYTDQQETAATDQLSAHEERHNDDNNNNALTGSRRTASVQEIPGSAGAAAQVDNVELIRIIDDEENAARHSTGYTDQQETAATDRLSAHEERHIDDNINNDALTGSRRTTSVHEISESAGAAAQVEEGVSIVDKQVYYIQGLGRCGADLTFVVAALVLGSFGSFMSGHILWMCWAILMLKLLMDLSIRPSWIWVTSYLSSRAQIINDNTLNSSCAVCAPSGFDLTSADRATAGDASVAGIKFILAIALLVSIASLKLSGGCSQSPCSDRARESMLGLALMVIVLEGIPLLLSCGKASGFNRVKRSYHILRHAMDEFRRDDGLSWPQLALILQSFHASASSAVLVSTGGLLVGGNFGNFMTRSSFWLCWSVVMVELLAEGASPTIVQLFRHWRPLIISTTSASDPKNGMEQENRRLKEEAIAKLLLRVPVQAILCGFLIRILLHRAFYPPDLDDSFCDKACRANTYALVLVMCIFTGSQVLSIFPLWAPLQILAALLPGFLAYVLIFFLMATLPVAALGILGFVTVVTYFEWDAYLHAIVVGCILGILYAVMYWKTTWKRRWLSPSLHFVLLTPLVSVGFFLSFFRYSASRHAPLVTLCLLLIAYIVLLLRGISSKQYGTY